MARTTFRAAACTVILSAWSLNSALAQTSGTALNSSQVAPAPPSAAASVNGSGGSNEAAGRASLDRVGDEQTAPQGSATAANPSVEAAGYHAGVIVHHPGPIPAPQYLPPYAPGIIPCQYPNLNAPLYPCPLPNIPYQTGGALITNQALDPHEMLYPHTYRSVYPPYYYEVHGGWKLFPWGVTQSEHWRLRGTVVTVKYSPSIGLFSGYVPPALNTLNVVRPHHWDHWDCNQ